MTRFTIYQAFVVKVSVRRGTYEATDRMRTFHHSFRSGVLPDLDLAMAASRCRYFHAQFIPDPNDPTGVLLDIWTLQPVEGLTW